MKRFFQGFLVLFGVLFAIVVAASAPVVLIVVAFVLVCWGVGRLIFGKSEPKSIKPERPKRDYVEPTKRAVNSTGAVLAKLFYATNRKWIKPVIEEAKNSINAKRKLKELEEELESLKREREFEDKLNKKAEAKD